MRLRTIFVLCALASVALPPAALAQDYRWKVRAGASRVQPNSDVLSISTGTLRVDEDDNVSADFTAMITPRWGVELYAGAFNHGITVDVAPGTPQGFGELDFTPVIATAQFHPFPDARVRPYVGAGVGLARFSGIEPAGLDVDDAVGAVVQAGVDVGITEQLLANVAVRWMSVEADVTQAGVALGGAQLDPYVFSLHVGWRFGRRAEPAAVVAPEPAPAAAPEPAPQPSPPVAVESTPPPANPTPMPADTDRDGVADATDLCPGSPAGTRVGPQGCSCDLTVRLAFGFDSAELTADDRRVLDRAAADLRRLPFTGVVEGHSDSVGGDAYNRALSERRARAVRDYLASRGIDAQRMNVVGYGETRPAADNATPAGRAENRRVVLRRTDCDR